MFLITDNLESWDNMPSFKYYLPIAELYDGIIMRKQIQNKMYLYNRIITQELNKNYITEYRIIQETKKNIYYKNFKTNEFKIKEGPILISNYVHPGITEVLENIPDSDYIIFCGYKKKKTEIEAQIGGTGKQKCGMTDVQDEVNRELQEEIGIEFCNIMKPTLTLLVKKKGKLVQYDWFVINCDSVVALDKNNNYKNQDHIRDNFRKRIAFIVHGSETKIINLLKSINTRRDNKEINTLTYLLAVNVGETKKMAQEIENNEITKPFLWNK